jgi:hypothetical protein
MSKCVSWKKKWIRMKAWCLELDGRQDKDECAKPIVGCGTGPAVDHVAVFPLVRFQEKEMRNAAWKKSTRRTFRHLVPSDLPPPKQGSCSAVGWEIAPAKALAECRNERGSPADVLGGMR